METRADNQTDFLSRYPSSASDVDHNEEEQAFVLKVDDLKLPTTSSQIAKDTTKDVLPLKVLKLTNEGWPNKLGSADLDFVPFFSQKSELYVMSEVVL